jgi:hypothetical protein
MCADANAEFAMRLMPITSTVPITVTPTAITTMTDTIRKTKIIRTSKTNISRMRMQKTPLFNSFLNRPLWKLWKRETAVGHSHCRSIL